MYSTGEVGSVLHCRATKSARADRVIATSPQLELTSAYALSRVSSIMRPEQVDLEEELARRRTVDAEYLKATSEDSIGAEVP